MTLIHNERTKLTATYVNNIGVAIFAVGGLAPLFTSLYGQEGPGIFLLAISALCFFVSVGLHWFARALLRGLDQ